MKARTIITAGLAAAALAGATATSASAVPTSVKYASQTGDQLYVGFNYNLPYSASYNPSFYASVWTDTIPARRVRALGRHELQSNYGLNTGAYFWFNYITALKPGSYFACVRGVVRLDSGAVSAHVSCRRFQLAAYGD